MGDAAGVPTHLDPFVGKDGPEIRTERLILRPLRESDDWGVFAMRSRIEVMKWSIKRVPDTDIAQTREHLRRFDKPLALGLVIVEADKQADPVCGILGFNVADSRVELGYMFHPDVWGKGYATEAVAAAIDAWWGDYAGARTNAAGAGDTTIWADTYPGNEPSYRVLIKCGFRKEADREDEDGQYEAWRLDRP